jgi:hypothetical protein
VLERDSSLSEGGSVAALAFIRLVTATDVARSERSTCRLKKALVSDEWSGGSSGQRTRAHRQDQGWQG